MTTRQSDGPEYQLRIQVRPSQLSEVRRSVSERLDLWGLAALSDDVCIVLTEALSNVHKHAGGGFSDIALWCSGAYLWTMVSDSSHDMPVLKDPDLTMSSGRGMRLIEALTDNWLVIPSHAGKWLVCWFAVPSTVMPTAAEELEQCYP